MPDIQKISPLVQEVSVQQDEGSQIITLVLKYEGSINILQKITEGEELTLELPSKPQP